MQLTSAYSIFANGGNQVAPYFIEKITDQQNKSIYEAPTPHLTRVITPQNAYLMTQAMQSVIQTGTAKAALVLQRSDLAGKTGTTNNQVDAWFAGFNSNLLATVWVGYDNSQQSLHEYGAQAALPIWISFMKDALAGQPLATMAQPADIVSERINRKTGLAASANDKNAIFEVFDKNALPLQAPVNNNDGNTEGDAYHSNGNGVSESDIF